jgi:hypothetical protein
MSVLAPPPQKQALGMVLDDSGVMAALGNPRCKRFCLYVDDGTVKVRRPMPSFIRRARG